MHKMLSQIQTVFKTSEHRVMGNTHIFHTHFSVIGWHVKSPPKEIHIEARVISRHQKCRYSYWIARFSGSSRKNNVVSGVM